MLLAVDVGNTNTKIALCDQRGDRMFATWRISSLRDRMPDEWFAILVSLLRTEGKRTEDVTGVAISSVVPGITTWLTEMCRRRIKVEPVVLASTQDLGLTILTEQPSETGIDRVINGVAAFARFGGPVVIVDCGTATKFDVVNAAGAFVGGAIAPGLEISLNALTGRAARLYAVSVDLPERAIGTSTVASIQSGVVLGYVALCEGMIRRILDEVGSGATVVATGGAADLVRRSIPAIAEYVPSLTLDGIRAAYQRLA
jgi:type III pantothenate kinase